MRATVTRFTIAAALAGSAAAAAAEPAPYPRDDVARPLLLPDRGVEGGAELATGVQDFDSESFEIFSLVPRVRVGLGGGEISADANLFLGDTSDTVTIVDNTLRRVGIAGRYPIAEDLAAGLALGLLNPGEDYSGYDLAALFSTKQRLSTASALELSGGPGLMKGSNDYQQVHVDARLAAIAQLTSTVSFQARAQLGWYDLTSPDPTFPDPGWSLYQTYGVGTLISIADDVDLTAGFDVQASGQYGYKTVSLGVNVRRLP